ncbi:fimbrial protein [Stenotrophomonas sp. AB1(2024)]|uniref:fimbrial protein n=1 Tax=Stenotrophomonas sp. AB1(2024) TaxID=3132215 RepID=UPI0030A4FF2D
MNTSSIHLSRRKQNRVLRCAAALLLMVGAQSAYAVADCTGPTPAVFTAVAPGGTHIVSKDAAIGTLLTPWTSWQGGASIWRCNMPGGVWHAAPVSRVFASSTSVTVDGYIHSVYATNLAGVGLIVQYTSSFLWSERQVNFGDYYQGLQTSNFVAHVAGKNNPDEVNQPWGFATRYAFVKTGPITGGTATVSGQIARAGMDLSPYSNPGNIQTINISGSAIFVVPSCVTPDVTVNLGQHRDSDFPSMGSRRGISGTYSDFNIGLLSCGAGMTSISYTLRPLNGEVSGLPGAIATTPGSTARGVAVRIADRSGTPVAFNSARAVSLTTYSAATGGNQAIPLRAWIERIGSSDFAGGSVQAQVEFTMTYR